MTQAGKAVIDQQDETEAGASGDDLGAPFSLSALRGGLGAFSHQQAAQDIYLCIACHYHQHDKWGLCIGHFRVILKAVRNRQIRICGGNK